MAEAPRPARIFGLHVNLERAMPRQPRFVLPGQPQHVIQRGNNRTAMFASPPDYGFFLALLRHACWRFHCQIHAYVLMTNHVHLVMTPSTDRGIAKVMQLVGCTYVQHFNRSYGRTGTLLEGRYRATVIDSECYLFTCMRYVELNPVRAGMVAHPAGYAHSSHRANALGEPSALVSAHSLYRQLGHTPAERQAAYRALFASHIPEHALHEIRKATNLSWVLGQTDFQREVERLSGRRAAVILRGRAVAASAQA